MPALDAIPCMMSYYSARCSPCKTTFVAASASSASSRFCVIVDGIGCAPGVADTGITSGLSAPLELAPPVSTGVSAGSALVFLCFSLDSRLPGEPLYH